MTHFVAICDYCRQIHTFPTAEARDEWLTDHPREED